MNSNFTKYFCGSWCLHVSLAALCPSSTKVNYVLKLSLSTIGSFPILFTRNFVPAVFLGSTMTVNNKYFLHQFFGCTYKVSIRSINFSLSSLIKISFFIVYKQSMSSETFTNPSLVQCLVMQDFLWFVLSSIFCNLPYY